MNENERSWRRATRARRHLFHLNNQRPRRLPEPPPSHYLASSTTANISLSALVYVESVVVRSNYCILSLMCREKMICNLSHPFPLSSTLSRQPMVAVSPASQYHPKKSRISTAISHDRAASGYPLTHIITKDSG